MTMEDPFGPNDPLALATAELREAAISDGPSAEVLARAQRLSRPRIGFKLGVLASAASIAVVFAAAVAILLLWRSDELAFADVAQTIGQTRTFTARWESAGGSWNTRLYVKGSRVRLEFARAVNVYDAENGTRLQLNAVTHVATISRMNKDLNVDLYTVIGNFHPGSAKSIGEKTINGKTAMGFAIANPDPDEPSWTFWVDPQTKLPVMVEDGPSLFTDFHFDVPLADSLFDMGVPSGYALAQDAWDRFKYAGEVVDERGKPVEGVKVTATIRGTTGAGFGFIDVVNTGADGRFTIDRDRGIGGSQSVLLHDSPIRLEFKHPDLLYGALQDVNLLSPEARADLHVRMRDGKKIDGRVVDSEGRPISGAMVMGIAGVSDNDLDAQFEYRKAVVTKTDGAFELCGLPADDIDVQVIRKGDRQPILSGHAGVDLSMVVKPLEITVRPFELPAGTVVHELFGMKLVDVDDQIRDRLFLEPNETVLILDPGKTSGRLKIGELEPGDAFFYVGQQGQTDIKNFKEFAQRLLSACEAEKNAGRTTYSVRVVYDFTRLDQAGSDTQYMSLNEEDLAELQRAVSGN
jgi:hypothetical protein